MTDLNEQELQQMIERVLAGEPVDEVAGKDAGMKRLLALARELDAERDVPSPDYEKELRRRLESLQAEAADSTSGTSPKEKAAWLPGWMTWRRVAAVAATLVVGLGIAGMTQAILTGEGPLDDDRGVVMKTDDDATVQADESVRLEPGEGTDAGATMELEDAAVAAGEPITGASLPQVELRRVIQTADYDIEVPVGSFQDRYDDISGIAARYGGYVVSSDTSISDGGEDQLKEGTITIRIANIGDNFDAAQAQIESLGKVVAKQLSGEDVTEEYVDLQSRLRNAEAQQASLLALMDRAGTIDEILMVQARLNEVQMEIEQLKGSIAYMESMTDFATVTVYMYEEDVDKEDDGDEEDDVDWGFVEAIKYAGWLSVQTVNFVIIALGVIIPSVLLISLAALVTYRIVRWRHGKS